MKLWVKIVTMSLAFVLGASACAAFLILRSRYRSRPPSAVDYCWDYNHDGQPDCWWHYENNIFVASQQDRNFDGLPDVWQHFDQGILMREELDENFDGKPDRWLTFRDGVSVFDDIDTDLDGITNVHCVLIDGVVTMVDWYTKAGQVFRRENYRHNQRYEELLDEDGDGWFEKRILYDALNRPTGTEAIHAAVSFATALSASHAP